MEQILLYLLLAAAAVSGLLETYKQVRKKAHDWEYRLIAGVLSVGLAAVIFYGGFGLSGNSLSLVLWAALVYVCQYFVSMEVMKKIFSAVLKKKGVEV